VARDPGHQEIGADVDWSRWYVSDEDDMGESPEQNFIIRLLVQCLEELSRERGWQNVVIGADAFFAWKPEEPKVRVSPDVYLLDDRPPGPLPRSWQTWRPGVKPPRLAVEIVSVDTSKDYDDAPERYAALGCGELVIFDPGAVQEPEPGRVSLTVYRREPDGLFAKTYEGEGPAFSAAINAWFVSRVVKGEPRVRLARDAEGNDLVPSSTERADAEAVARQAEARRADALAARVAELEAELRRQGK
jgi:Uma2 family endonuclease